ncbi:extensin family protein [Tropicimonas sp.]|uniref:extensin-like domain-containing protein n=1 Tax=Tropicimonas sp. TaxID=2067044 RepID=UPI003A848E7E
MRKRTLGFVIAALLAATAAPAAQVTGAGMRPVARPGPEVLQPASAIVSRAGPAGQAAESTGTPGQYRPIRRDGIFAEHREPADSRVAVARQVTRIRYDAAHRPAERPPHPLAGYGVVPVSAVMQVAPGTPQPHLRPAGFFEKFRRRFPSAGNYSAKGAVCGVDAIKGTQIASFGNPAGGCGVDNPVRVTSVAGVALSAPATIDCTTARALNAWVEKGVKPAFGRQGGGVVKLNVAAHYVCRNRNNRSGGRLSEHAKGRAVDISAIVLRDGTQVTVLNGWSSGKWGDEMKKAHRAACGPFGTVLGPRSDSYHRDHFHVDTARYRSGSYCR